MIKNFLVVAIRTFLRQRLYSFINVFGLASGLVSALFIYLWVNDELSKDRFHTDSEKIFQVVSNLEFNEGEILTWPITPGPLAENIVDNVPEVEMAVRTMPAGSMLFQYGENGFMESGMYADPDYFKLFSFKILKGKPKTDTLDVSGVSISEKLADKLFGDEDAIGKTIKINNKLDVTVAAVFADVGTESSIHFDYILPFEIYKKNRGEGFHWGNYDHPLYIKLNDPSRAGEVMAKINDSAKKVNTDTGVEFYLQPFTEYYLNAQYENGRPVGGRIKYVTIFSVVAIFILVIACINFMNMATAKAVTRAKEVGVRKVIGAQRKSLIFQFMAESTLISLISMMFALGVVLLLLPLFNTIVEKNIILEFDSQFLIVCLAIVLITGLLAGSYPAFFLSAHQPSQVLKGASNRSFGGSTLRQSLVVFQFALTVILIASAMVIYNQIEFIRNKNIGYNRESVLTFNLRSDMRRNFEVVKNEILQHSSIKQVSRADNSLVEVQNQNGSVQWPGRPENFSMFFRTVVVDYDFLETMGMEIKEGRFFNKASNDTNTFILTQRAVEVMQLKEPVGTVITQWGTQGRVIGVVNDFHSRSLHEAIDPVVFMLNPEWPGRAVVRFEAGKTQEAIAHVESVYKKYNAQFPFTYSFLDDDFEKLYNNEKVTGSLALGFTGMAIIISGLGLLGLASYTAERRKKEISIRKTLGASVSSIVTLMSADFIKLTLIAALIGCPGAYFLMQKFLEGYAYHPELKWSIFIITAAIALVLSLFTVIFQVTKAAIANPVDALKNE